MFYFLALIPIIIGFFLWWLNKKVVWVEWLIGCGASLFTALTFNIIAITGMTGDVETWSGIIDHVEHRPRWVEEYTELHTREVPDGVDKDGHTTYRTEYYTTIEHDTHPEHWRAYLDFGKGIEEEAGLFDSSYKEIEKSLYDQIMRDFGGKIVVGGTQPTSHGGKFDGGDNKIYATLNETGYTYPVTKIVSFENRIKAAPSLFSFASVPTNAPVFEYPQNKDWMVSDRLLGTAGRDIDILLFDRMNSRLGPTKKVNVIMVGFGNGGSELAEYQQSKWIGGKKNDLVLCYGDGWSRVFGWTDEELVKQNLQTILLNNKVDNSILPLVEKEIKANYTIKNWDDFAYISIEPRPSHFIWYGIIMVITQTGLYIFFHLNQFQEGKTMGEIVDTSSWDYRKFSGNRTTTKYRRYR